MAVVAIFSPGWYASGQSGTQFVANPWGTQDAPDSPVWIQCSMPFTETWDTAALAAWGIIEVEFLDDNGQFQRTQSGDPSNLGNVFPDKLVPRLAVPRFLGATFALLNVNVGAGGTVTLFLWG